MAGIDDGEVGFEEAISCLPSHFLDEAIWDYKEYVKHQQHHHHQYRSLPELPLDRHPQAKAQTGHASKHVFNSKSVTIADKFKFQNRSKSSARSDCRTKNVIDRASGGPGMQAVFLDSGKKSSGTGVFLPQRGGTSMQPSKKPACAPVLLPARVVQALNINVHEIGLRMSRRQDAKNKSKGRDCNSLKNKNSKDVSAQCAVVSNNENSSPEIFLPKEWTY